MAIRLERNDAVATIVNDRPEARNAVDGPASRALAQQLGVSRRVVIREVERVQNMHAVARIDHREGVVPAVVIA